MPHLNLDALRAERLAEADPKDFTLFGQTFALPPEVQVDVADAWATGDALAGLRLLLGDPEYERFDKLVQKERWTVEDLKALANGIAVMYGFADSGESPASVSSLPNGQSRSRRTSRAGTA